MNDSENTCDDIRAAKMVKQCKNPVVHSDLSRVATVIARRILLAVCKHL